MTGRNGAEEIKREEGLMQTQDRDMLRTAALLVVIAWLTLPPVFRILDIVRGAASFGMPRAGAPVSIEALASLAVVFPLVALAAVQAARPALVASVWWILPVGLIFHGVTSALPSAFESVMGVPSIPGHALVTMALGVLIAILRDRPITSTDAPPAVVREKV